MPESILEICWMRKNFVCKATPHPLTQSVQPKQALKCSPASLYLLSSRIAGVYHQAWLDFLKVIKKN